MSLSPAAIDALVAAGVSAEQLAAAVKAELAAMEAERAERRARAAAKKRRQRANVPVCPGDIEGQAGTEGDTLSLPSSPQTPQQPTHTRGDISTRARGADFDVFWAAYPKRVAKDAARKAFDRAVKRIPGEALATILSGLERALPGWDDPTYIPHPATWLNAGRWDDDAPTPRTMSPANDRPDHHRQPDRRRDDREANLARAFAAADAVAERGFRPS